MRLRDDDDDNDDEVKGAEKILRGQLSSSSSEHMSTLISAAQTEERITFSHTNTDTSRDSRYHI